MSTFGTNPLLDAKGVTMRFPLARPGPDGRRSFEAIRNIDVTVNDGETVAIVGESGCGKTTLGRCIVRVYEPSAGRMDYHLRMDGEDRVLDLCTADPATLRRVRQQVRMIFQDPFSSLNPRMTIADILADGMKLSGRFTPARIRERSVDLLERVGLRPDVLNRYPHAFSGGQRQRIVIARALALDPRLVVADEAVSALDVSVRAQILELMRELQERLGLTYIFISHDLSVVEYIADRVVVMYLGEIVESAGTEALYSKPLHPYTEALLAAIPIPDPEARGRRQLLKGDVADPRKPPSGCRFHPRCAYAQDICRTTSPTLQPVGEGRKVACHFASELNLAGV